MNFSLKNEKQFKKCLSLKTVLRDQFRTIYKPVQKVKKPVKWAATKPLFETHTRYLELMMERKKGLL